MTLIYLSLAWLAGIAVADRVGVPLRATSLTAAALLVGLVLWKDHRAARIALACGVVACLGTARATTATRPPSADHISLLNDTGVVRFRGTIIAEPDRRDRRVDYRVAVEAVEAEARREMAAGAHRMDRTNSPGDPWHPATGIVLVQAARFPTHHYGAEVEVSAELESPPVFDGFDYRRWLAHKGIHSVARRAHVETLACCTGNPLRRALLAVKDRGRTALAASIPEPEAALATGIVLGDARGIPERVDQAFRATNTTHVIAISGSNVAIVVGIMLAALAPLVGRRRAVPAVLIALALYTALVGADAAVVRAAFMGGIMLLGTALGRKGHALTALMASAWAMTVYRPGYIDDLGFQLSFAATIGLLAFSEPLSQRFGEPIAARLGAGRGGTLMSVTNEAVLITLAAQITTWPLIAHHVGQVSLVGLAANFLIVPAQTAVMVLGAATAVAGSLHGGAGSHQRRPRVSTFISIYSGQRQKRCTSFNFSERPKVHGSPSSNILK